VLGSIANDHLRETHPHHHGDHSPSSPTHKTHHKINTTQHRTPPEYRSGTECCRALKINIKNHHDADVGGPFHADDPGPPLVGVQVVPPRRLRRLRGSPPGHLPRGGQNWPLRGRDRSASSVTITSAFGPTVYTGRGTQDCLLRPMLRLAGCLAQFWDREIYAEAASNRSRKSLLCLSRAVVTSEITLVRQHRTPNWYAWGATTEGATDTGSLGCRTIRAVGLCRRRR